MEVALLGWLGSLLFALPLLRNSLPNAPPIGASIDILLFLWVLLAAMAAMILSAITWTRAKKAELNALHDDNKTRVYNRSVIGLPASRAIDSYFVTGR